MVILTESDKQRVCITLARHLPRLREILSMSQNDLGERSGVSKDRISRIENGHFVMTWSQLTSFMFVFLCNKSSKEYIYANNLISARFVQYLQMKDENIPPEMNIVINSSLIENVTKLDIK